MNILILQGPNLNMLGLKSSKTKANVTLDKINRALKKHVKGKNVSLKLLQTHKQFQAVNFLQRNRNWADGILFIPTSWARNEFTILETLELINLKTATIYFNDSFSFGTDEQDSIIVGDYIQSFTGDPLEACVTGLEHLLS
ncbi:MAG TPA: type II 3-dehydroquinate dehydratase [Candidatus Marinimicrobia bacterium]|jgi:3-dehydroquinate dehydratase-2|nr:type II 3-dehydroquinate dehydratase [Candidatus Neomarinimicrobiota bacterium]HIB05851.1 type II 3-dehydroquinate dehydratase [Candidatus Neomarinimicrobiota bacterium]|tara:strand:+ start:307 stop:729 length:423 start_codon:yes stop_codon:yes gene_type:complete